MASRYDIKLTGDSDDLFFADGDFVISTSDEQHIKDTMQANPGNWKQYPEEGVGINSWLGGPIDKQAMSKKIRLQLENDGYVVNNPTIEQTTDGLIVNPNATLQ